MNKILILRKTAALIFITLCLSSCDKKLHNYYYDLPSYIQEYVEITELKTRHNPAGDGLEIELYPSGSERYSFLSEGEMKSKYDNICILNGDTNYNRDVTLTFNTPSVISYYPNIISINVISDTDFDEEHPKGSSLNEYINVGVQSAHKYIMGGYNDEMDVPKQIWMPLNAVTADDLKTLTSRLNLEFTKSPNILQPHTLTISITTEDGEEFQASIKKEKFVE